MNVKLFSLGLTSILATPIIVTSSTQQSLARPCLIDGSCPPPPPVVLCSQDPKVQNCDWQDPIAQQCPADPNFLLANDIKDAQGHVIGQVQLRWSSVCKSNWTRVIANDANAPITFASIGRQTAPSGTNPPNLTGLGYSDSKGIGGYKGLFYTDMLWADNINAKACGAINNSPVSCASQF